MLIRVEREWIDKPFPMEGTSLINVDFNATLKEIKDICKTQILRDNEWEHVKDINPVRFDYIDSDGFQVICNIYLNESLERHLDNMLNVNSAIYKERDLYYIREGYKMALEAEGYDCKRLEVLFDAYAKLKNSR